MCKSMLLNQVEYMPACAPGFFIHNISMCVCGVSPPTRLLITMAFYGLHVIG